VLACYVQHIPAFPLLLHPLEVDANVIDILISNQSIELIVVSPPQLGFLSEQLANQIVLLPHSFPQPCHLVLQLSVAVGQPLPINPLASDTAKYVQALLFLLVAALRIFLAGSIE
jgi:hypothetical protein